ncbi:hypothetical protein BJY21_004028 [Kineosphaera limosa]|uniref:Beta-lactamase class A catalytic domain-containing protein n=1 Tax=Kineosphaera limosa NBRC 100340 TaxID=1184609 RepID=K6X644_9MICO|nr:serine hydrolase [Kineosphaera limosa]NYE02844.1 hypothetical protein [Kineosphaera limosa]GAB94274.1 hypothetical protein KILIM_004_00640 [Kineosphaera limosa NBRC 100340]
MSRRATVAATVVGALLLTGCSGIQAEPGSVTAVEASATPSVATTRPTPGQVTMVSPTQSTPRSAGESSAATTPGSTTSTRTPVPPAASSSSSASVPAGSATHATTPADQTPDQAGHEQPTTDGASSTTNAASPAATPLATPEIDTRTLPPAGHLDPDELQAALAPVRERYGDRLAVAWGPVGEPAAVRSVGATKDVESWSTIKAPIALAIEQQADGEPSESVRRQVRLMLTVSDNAAASALWRELGDPATRVRQVLREAGDETTVPARDADGAAVTFGLTAWQPADAARFATMLPCAPEADPVLDLLGSIDSEHQWGLGTVADARFKGGWGPSPHGYLARQVGVIPRHGDQWVGVAIAAQPDADNHAQAVAAIDEATTILVSLLGYDDAGTCPR